MNAPSIRAPSVRVPGLLTDEALQEQLRALAAQGTEQARATAPNSAVEMSQQIAQDFVVNPMRRTTPTMRQPAAAPGGAGPATGPADSTALTPPGSVNARDAASSMLFGFFSPIGGMLSEQGLIGRLGALSPQEAEAEQAQRVEQAEAAQAAQSAAATARQQLRNMTDEQAASMGLPVAPGVLDAETVRLLDEQGERREAFDAARAQEAEAATRAARDTAPTATWWLDAARNAYKGVTGMGTQAARGIVIPLEMLARSDKSEAREWIDTLDATIEKMVPGDKARSKDFLTKLSAGGGSMIGFMIGGMVAAGVGLPATAGTLMMGAVIGGAEQYTDAERFNAGGVQKLLSYFLGMGIGATEAIPINNMLFRMENATGGVVSRMLQSTAASSMEEFIQELGQAVGSDVVAMALYDENREIDWGEAFENAAVGGILGGMMGSAAATVGALQEVAAGRAVEPEQAAVVEAERVAAVDEFLTRTQEVFDQRMRTMAEAVAVEETLAPVETLAMEGVAPETAQAVAADVAQPVAPDAVAAALVEQAQAAPRPPTQLADDFVAALERPPLFEQNTVESTGGRVPAPDASGAIVLRHYAPEVRETLDPKFQGTGPLVGDERRSRPDRPQAVYYGVQTGPDFVQPATPVSDYAKLTPAEKKAARALQDAGVSEGMIRGALEARYRAERETSGYQREGGLGVFEHEVRVRPEELYNIRQDPLGLKSQLPTNLTSNERISILEGMVRDAGFRGAYYERSPLGQTVTLFDAAAPERVVDTRYGLPVDDIASLTDFANLTAEAFNKGGWAVVTATQEALGPASAPENVAANERLRKRLARDGVQYIEVSGAYKGEPQGESFLIFAPEEYAKKLGKSLKQESILTRRGLEYSDGRITPVDPSQTVVGEGARELDFYSQTPDGTAFSLGLDFDATTDAMAMAASNLTGDQWTAQEIGETIAGWVEAATNPESQHALAQQIRELAANAGNLDADQLAQVLAGQLAAGRPAAIAEGTEAAERAGDGPWTVAAQRQQDAEPAGREDGPGEVLASRAPVDTSSESFRRWFGDSKVVDDQGKPLVVYHGTSAEFEAFDASTVRYPDQDGSAFFFTSQKGDAEAYAYEGGDGEPRLIEAYLSIRNPLTVRADTGQTAIETWDYSDGAIRKRAADAGHDGVIIKDSTGGDLFVAFSPEQIKSVNNRGTFDPENPNIYAQTGQGRGGYRAEPQRPRAGVPGQPGAADADIRLAKIADNFTKLLDLTIRQGRFTLRGGNVMGQYSSRQDVVRLRTPNDLSTLVHEGGHALQANASGPMQAFINGHIDELQKVAKALYGGDLSKADNATKTAEGFAEFFRVYVTNRAFAERKYAKLTADFDAVLDTDPAMRDGLRAIGEQFAAWLQLPSAQLVRNMIESGKQVGRLNEEIAEIQSQGFGTWMHEVARNSLAAAVNQNAALDDLVAGVLNIAQESRGQALDLKRAEDPRALIRLATNSGNRGMVQVNDGVMGHRSTVPVTRSLRDALLRYHGLNGDQNLSAIDPERQTDFAAYLVALRGIDEYRRFAEGKIERPPVAATLGDLKITVEEMNGKYGGDFAEAAQIVHEYGMGLWQKAFDAGLMSKQTYKDGLDRQFYAPLQRDMSDRSGGPAMSDIAGASAARPVRRFRGSDRNIIDPMDALMAKTFALERVIAENEVKKALAMLADKAGKAGALVERIPAQQLLGTEYSVQEVARQLTKDDTLSQADAQDLMTMLEASIEEGNRIALFRSQQAQARGENVVFFWENGKLSALQIKDGDVGADVVNTLNAVGTENMPLFVNALAHTSTAFRSAITSWPDFIMVNFIRDQVSAWLLTDVGYKPFVTGFGGVANEIRQKTWARQYNAAMGIMGGMNTAALHEARVKRDIGELRKRGYLVQAFSGRGPAGFIRGMARVAEVSETGTRLGLFQKAFEKAKADGLTDWEASIEASYLATDYMNFGLHGNRVMAHRRLIPFLNAQVQGLYKMMRTLGGDEVRQRRGLRFVLTSYFKDLNGLDLSRQERAALNTGRKAWVKMMSLGLIGALLTFLFEDDPDYQDTSEYLRATGWVIPLGGGEIAYIPKPFELAVVSNFVERAIEHASGDDEAKARFLRGAMMNLTPPTAPPAVVVLIEQLANHSFFAGREIVPDYMRALSPELQYNHYTSELAKQIGNVMGWSPMRVDHVLNGMGASAYRDLTQMYNTLDPNRPNSDPTDWPITRRFVRDARRGAVSAADFWKFASTVDGSLRRGEITYRQYLDTGRERAAEEFLDTLDEDHRSYALLNAHFKADAKRLNPMYRARQITGVISAFRRELPTELGLEDTGPAGGEIRLSSKTKAEVDEILSEISRREVRNTLVAMGAPGWANKKPLPVQPSIDLLHATSPEAAEEFERRWKKAKIYDGDLVREYWPEVRDRLLSDRNDAFLNDIVTIAKATQ